MIYKRAEVREGVQETYYSRMLRKTVFSPYDHLIASLMVLAVGWGGGEEGNGYLNDDDSHNK